MDEFKASLLKKAVKESEKNPSPASRTYGMNFENVTVDDTKRFLEYKCNYKKHKGKTWGEVLQKDMDYFTWAMTVMPSKTVTWNILAPLVLSKDIMDKKKMEDAVVNAMVHNS